jgi:hypothetical protein
MTQKKLDALCQAESRKCGEIFFSEKSKRKLATNHPPLYSLRVSNTTANQKKTSMIIVRDRNGKLVNCYTPNNIGKTFAELYNKAKEEANKIGGYVTL